MKWARWRPKAEPGWEWSLDSAPRTAYAPGGPLFSELHGAGRTGIGRPVLTIGGPPSMMLLRRLACFRAGVGYGWLMSIISRELSTAPDPVTVGFLQVVILRPRELGKPTPVTQQEAQERE